MKGIVCEEIGRLTFKHDLEEPVLKSGNAIVHIRRMGICGTDYHAFLGNQPFFHYPRILGHELAGVIEEIGDNDFGLQPGDQVSIVPYMHCGCCIACRNGKTNCCQNMRVLGVHIDGGMRERICIPVEQLINTNSMSLDQSVILEPLAIGAHAIRRCGVTADSTVLVIGAGPIGLGVMALAKFAGARVFAMDVNEERLAFCKSWAKVEDTLNAMQTPKEKLAEMTNGDLAPVIIDATGNAKSMMNTFDMVSHGGLITYVGLVNGDISFHDPDFHSREITLMGSRNATREDFDLVIQAVSTGYIKPSGYLTHRASFEGMIEEFHTWLQPASGVIKAVVEL